MYTQRWNSYTVEKCWTGREEGMISSSSVFKSYLQSGEVTQGPCYYFWRIVLVLSNSRYEEGWDGNECRSEYIDSPVRQPKQFALMEKPKQDLCSKFRWTSQIQLFWLYALNVACFGNGSYNISFSGWIHDCFMVTQIVSWLRKNYSISSNTTCFLIYLLSFIDLFNTCGNFSH